MVFEKIKRKLAQKIITEEDIKNSKCYNEFLESYQEVHKELRELLRRFKDFAPYKNQEDIDFYEEGEKLIQEISQLEKLILGKDKIIMHEKLKSKNLKKELTKIEKKSISQIPQEILYAAMLHITEPIIALDTKMSILDFTSEASEYFGEIIQRNMPYYELFQEKKEFNEFREKARSLVPKESFDMKIHFRERDYLNTLTKPAYNKEGNNCRGYLTKIETEGKLKALLGYIKKKISSNKEKDPIKDYESEPEPA